MTTMKKVKSSNIAVIGYNAEKFKLLVEFKNGKTFGYKYVSSDEYKELLAAESVGKHFNAFIKSTKVAQEIVAEKEAPSEPDKDECISKLKERLESALGHIIMIERVAACAPIDREILSLTKAALEIDEVKGNV